MVALDVMQERLPRRVIYLCVFSLFLGALVPSVYLLLQSPSTPPPLSYSTGVTFEQSCTNDDAPRRDVCVEPAFSVQGVQSDWNRLKVIPPLALCTVQGFPIERLEPELNFRRLYSLGHAASAEDKTQLLPFLRATRDLCLATRQRRVLLDLGGRDFDSSVTWFLRFYPLEFTEVHVFEASRGKFRIPGHSNIPEEVASSQMTNESKVVPLRMDIPNSVLDKISLRIAYADTKDEPPSVNLTRVMKEELKLTRHDTVIVKMDIEWAEWNILPVWLEDPEMPYIVDELFVEIHYQHPSMFPYWWNKGPSREEAFRMYQKLRDRGFFLHPWP